MTLQIELINELKALPCFDEIETIDLLVNGLSQTSMKVTTKSRLYFAKKLNNDTANVEVTCALLCSQKASENDLTHQLSPTVLYHDKQWLVTAFISGEPLIDISIDIDVKYSVALKLMANLHQFSTARIERPIPELDTNLSVARLLSKPIPLLAQNRHILDSVDRSLTSVIDQIILASGSSSVLCHGDMNYTNILIDNIQKPWLIDFECAHKAPVEFDLAMFVAVNNVPIERLDDLLTDYRKLNQAHDCNIELLKYYIAFSFYINGLWYLDNKSKDKKSEVLFHELAVAQWTSFDCFSEKYGLQLPKLLPLLNKH